MTFARDHDGHALTTVRLLQAARNLHVERLRKAIQPTAKTIYIEVACGPRCLQDHAELPPCHLLLEGFDVGFLLEKVIRDARDDAGLVAPDDCDGRHQSFHGCGDNSSSMEISHAQTMGCRGSFNDE